MARVISTSLHSLRAAELNADGEPLSVEAYAASCDLIIVERIGASTLEIVDGYHRASGLLAWAREQGHDLTQIMVQVVDATDFDSEIVALAATPSARQQDALDTIYASL